MANPKFALEVPYKIKENYPEVLKKYWGKSIENPVTLFKSAQDIALEIGADYIGFYFNIDDLDEVDDCVETLKKIKEVARENFVPIVENKPLARMLYYNVELEQEIPEELYQMAAEVLRYVYSLKAG